MRELQPESILDATAPNQGFKLLLKTPECLENIGSALLHRKISNHASQFRCRFIDG